MEMEMDDVAVVYWVAGLPVLAGWLESIIKYEDEIK